jgi:hypothetical protein
MAKDTFSKPSPYGSLARYIALRNGISDFNAKVFVDSLLATAVLPVGCHKNVTHSRNAESCRQLTARRVVRWPTARRVKRVLNALRLRGFLKCWGKPAGCSLGPPTRAR